MVYYFFNKVMIFRLNKNIELGFMMTNNRKKCVLILTIIIGTILCGAYVAYLRYNYLFDSEAHFEKIISEFPVAQEMQINKERYRQNACEEEIVWALKNIPKRGYGHVYKNDCFDKFNNNYDSLCLNNLQCSDIVERQIPLLEKNNYIVEYQNNSYYFKLKKD